MKKAAQEGTSEGSVIGSSEASRRATLTGSALALHKAAWSGGS